MEEAKFNKETYKGLIHLYSRDRYKVTYDVKEKNLSFDAFAEDVKTICEEYYPEEEDVKGVTKALIENLFGYGIITPLIDDEDITDIRIIDENHIRVKKFGERFDADIKFSDREHFDRFIDAVKTRNEVNASTVNAISRFDDDSSSEKYVLRFTMFAPYITATKKPYLIIRKEPKDFYTIDDLANKEKLKTEEPMIPPEIKDMLIERWKMGSMIVAGAMSAGKSYFLNAIKEMTPDSEAMIIIQQVNELSTKKHPDTMFLHSVEGNSESETSYSLGDIAIGALTSDVDRIIIGEIKGKESSDLLHASYTGSKCAGTVHSNSAEEAIDKVVDYALESHKYSKRELMKMMTSFKTVVYLKKFKIEKVVEVCGYDEATENMKYNVLYSRT